MPPVFYKLTLKLRAGQALSDDLCFQSDTFGNAHPCIVARKPCLALFVDEQYESNHSLCQLKANFCGEGCLQCRKEDKDVSLCCQGPRFRIDEYFLNFVPFRRLCEKQVG